MQPPQATYKTRLTRIKHEVRYKITSSKIMPTCDHTVEVNVPTQFVTVIGQWKNFKFLNKSKQWCSTNHIILFGFNWKILDFLYGGKFKEFHELIHIICDAWFLSLVRDEFLSKGYFQKHDIKLKVLCSLQYLPPSSPCQSIPVSTVHKVFFFVLNLNMNVFIYLDDSENFNQFYYI